MVIKQYHRKEISALIIHEVIILLFFMFALIYSNAKDWEEKTLGIILAWILAQVVFLYFFSFELRTYIIYKDEITVKWLRIFNYHIDWSDIISVSYETVRILSGIEHSSIVISKIPIKRIDLPVGINSYFVAVDYDWLQMRPGKAIAIYLEDLKPNQYEEFWSYVPERLKGNYKPKEELRNS